MSLKEIRVDFPIKLQDIFHLTYDFDNLIRVIDFLHQNSLQLMQELKDQNKRLYFVETLKYECDELKTKTENLSLELPAGAAYALIDDLFSLENIKHGLTINVE